MKKFKVLIGDDHELILSGLKDLLSKIEEVAQVDATNNRADLIKMVAAKKYDIVFLDIHFGKHDGRDIAVELKQKFPEVDWRGAKSMRNFLVHEYFSVI